jgi:hypothetical protein
MRRKSGGKTVRMGWADRMIGCGRLQQVTVPVGGQADAGGFTVGVERVTEREVVVRVRP